MSQWVEIAKDFATVTFWLKAVLPVVGSMSLAQIYKLHIFHTTGKKPQNYMCALVATIFCMALLILVHGLMGTEGWRYAAGVGVMIGPAAPFLWWIATALAPERVSRAMRGKREQRNEDRTPGAWTKEQREKALRDTLYGDNDDTLRNKIRRAKQGGSFDAPEDLDKNID